MNHRHQIYELLGSGGFASVYKARDSQLGRDIAIKRLKHKSSDDHRQLREQMLAEAKILASLHHPNIVTIHDVIETDEGADIVMEFISGSTLADVVNSAPLEVNQFIFIATQLLSALTTAHENNVLHGDLKPINVMLTRLEDENYQATLIDFGVSPSLETDKPISQTKEQSLVGSIHFMAPEQLEKKNTSPQSDIYSLGCLFYYMLTGQYPFQGDSAVLVIASHMTHNFTPLQQVREDLPDSLCQWIESHLHLNPEERIPTCRESLDSLFQLKGLSTLDKFSEIHREKDMTRTGIIQSLSTLSRAKVQLSEKQKLEFSKRKNSKLTDPATERIPLSSRFEQARPESLWYFSINNARKGPVHFSKICELIAQGFVRSNDTIWHPRIGQWTPAIEVPEFQEEFQAAKKMPPRPQNTKRVIVRESARVTQSVPTAQRLAKINRNSQKSDKPLELALSVALTVTAILTVFLEASLWQLILLVYSGLLALLALAINRFHMKAASLKWLLAGICLPILSDLAFACVKPKKGLQCVVMLLLALACFHYTTQHRYAEDYLSTEDFSFLNGSLWQPK